MRCALVNNFSDCRVVGGFPVSCGCAIVDKAEGRDFPREISIIGHSMQVFNEFTD